jgi:hypothetical protein
MKHADKLFKKLIVAAVVAAFILSLSGCAIPLGERGKFGTVTMRIDIAYAGPNPTGYSK